MFIFCLFSDMADDLTPKISNPDASVTSLLGGIQAVLDLISANPGPEHTNMQGGLHCFYDGQGIGNEHPPFNHVAAMLVWNRIEGQYTNPRIEFSFGNYDGKDMEVVYYIESGLLRYYLNKESAKKEEHVFFVDFRLDGEAFVQVDKGYVTSTHSSWLVVKDSESPDWVSDHADDINALLNGRGIPSLISQNQLHEVIEAIISPRRYRGLGKELAKKIANVLLEKHQG